MQPYAFALAEDESMSRDGEHRLSRDERPNTVDGMGSTKKLGAVQLRVVVEADDFDEALAFYRDHLGLPEEEAYEADGGARVVILGSGRATLELANRAQVALIDTVEVGKPASPHIRIAFEVEDTEDMTSKLIDAGADLIAPPVETPWRSLNSRLDAPAGLQLTIFQELDK